MFYTYFARNFNKISIFPGYYFFAAGHIFTSGTTGFPAAPMVSQSVRHPTHEGVRRIFVRQGPIGLPRTPGPHRPPPYARGPQASPVTLCSLHREMFIYGEFPPVGYSSMRPDDIGLSAIGDLSYGPPLSNHVSNYRCKLHVSRLQGQGSDRLLLRPPHVPHRRHHGPEVVLGDRIVGRDTCAAVNRPNHIHIFFEK